jgi:carboxymethylenebutenolidase
MGEMVSYASDGGTGSGYLALPPSGSGPGVIVIQEWWGLVGHIASVADRFADAGFLALAPDLYHGETTAEPDQARELAMELELDTVAAEIAGAADHLAGLPQSAGGRVGAVGFCLGGSLALWSATLSDQITTVVAFYPGAAIRQRLSPRWERYAGKTAAIHCAEHDGASADADIQALYAEITKAGGTCTLYDYPGTKHAFFNDDRPEAFDADAAAGAWARTLDTLRTGLG